MTGALAEVQLLMLAVKTGRDAARAKIDSARSYNGKREARAVATGWEAVHNILFGRIDELRARDAAGVRERHFENKVLEGITLRVERLERIVLKLTALMTKPKPKRKVKKAKARRRKR